MERYSKTGAGRCGTVAAASAGRPSGTEEQWGHSSSCHNSRNQDVDADSRVLICRVTCSFLISMESDPIRYLSLPESLCSTSSYPAVWSGNCFRQLYRLACQTKGNSRYMSWENYCKYYIHVLPIYARSIYMKETASYFFYRYPEISCYMSTYLAMASR